MTYTFSTRAGLKFTIAFKSQDERNVTGEVIKGRKPFKGKTLAFPKHDMADLVISAT